MRNNVGIIVENKDRELLICNSRFCDIFGIPVAPKKMVGEDCSKSAEFVKHLFAKPDKFVTDIEIILRERKAIVGEKILMADGTILVRDYLPFFSGDEYMGHTWQYYIGNMRVRNFNRWLKNLFNR